MTISLKKVLVANRGEIASRIIATCRRLNIATVAVYSDPDANSPHVAQADESVNIGPAPVGKSYLDVSALMSAIEQTGADAVHPGYGLLSESGDFARVVRSKGIVFIGPPVEALHAFGDKIRARAVARAVGVEPPPGTVEPCDPEDVGGLTARASELGYPLLVKAAGGGGGIGMQLVQEPSELPKAARTCSDRGRAAFGDPRIYLERYLERPRHIEVQVLVDTHGNALALGERECSVQRRHQKIVEEAPSPAAFLDAPGGGTSRVDLGKAAVAIVKEAEYLGAGTVEFVAGADGRAYFLEVNARLQVEHPVTEMVFGLDLVEEQLRIACGLELSDRAKAAEPKGHAIEARLYAEDPDKRFFPQPGHLEALSFPELPSVRVDAGFGAGQDVTPHYDPLIAKIIAHGATRREARERLDAALAATDVRLVGPKGVKATNLGFLRRVLADERFAAGDYDTGIVASILEGR